MANQDDGPNSPKPGRVEHAISALNAWVGDYLAATGNGLHQPMGFFVGNEPVAPEDLPASVTGRVCVLVHGLGCNESLWAFPARHGSGGYGQLLDVDLGYMPLYVRYNTGLRISENGRALQELLTRYCDHHGTAVRELVLIGHSMGGLVIRSACHLDEQARWTPLVRHVFYLGSPHLGAPLEKAANVVTHLLGRVDTTATRVIGDLINTRSSGVKDLRYGNLVERDWLDYDPDELLSDRRVPIPWLDTASHYRVLGHALPGVPTVGDAVVRPASAAAEAGAFQPGAPRAEHVVVMEGLDHLSLARHPAVYEHIKRWVNDDG